MGIAPDALREMVATRLTAKAPQIDVLALGPLQMRLLHPNGRTDDLDLHGLTEQLGDQMGPTDIDSFVDDYVSAVLQHVLASQGRAMVVVVRTADWVKKIVATTPNVAEMPIVGDVHAVLAWDDEGGFDYDMGGDVPQEALMVALNNVLSRVDRLVLHGEDPFLVAVGGKYEASLMLAGQVWDDLGTRVQGDVVVSVPAHDLLLASGTGDPETYERFKNTVSQAWDSATEGKLSPKIYRWGAGCWHVHDEAALALA